MAMQMLDFGDGEEVEQDSTYCDICKIGFANEQKYINHTKGKVHEMKAAALKIAKEKREQPQESDNRTSGGNNDRRGENINTEAGSAESETEEGEIEWQDEWSADAPNVAPDEQSVSKVATEGREMQWRDGWTPNDTRYSEYKNSSYEQSFQNRGYGNRHGDFQRSDPYSKNNRDYPESRGYQDTRERDRSPIRRLDPIHDRNEMRDQFEPEFDSSRDRSRRPWSDFRDYGSSDQHRESKSEPYDYVPSHHQRSSVDNFRDTNLYQSKYSDSYSGSQSHGAPKSYWPPNPVLDSAISKKPKPPELPKEFYCEICKVQATGEATFKSHLVGAKHSKNMKKAVLEPHAIQDNIEKNEEKAATEEDLNIAGFELPTEARAQKVVDAYSSSPLIGLRYVTEYLSGHEAAKYVCNMCEVRLDIASLIAHVTSTKHRINYMKESYMNYYTQLQQCRKTVGYTKTQNASKVEEFATEIENQTGREKIKVKVDTKKTSKDDVAKLMDLKRQLELAEQLKASKSVPIIPANAHRFTINDALGKAPGEKLAVVEAGLFTVRKDTPQDKGQPSYNSSVDPSDGGGASSQSESGGGLGFNLGAAGSAGLAEMVKELSSCLVNNEEEAALALQVSNTLTQALLRYRLSQSQNNT